MAIEIEFAPAGQYLNARLSGEFSMPGATAALADIFAEYAGISLRGVLIDLRELRGVPATMDRYKVSMLYAEHARKMALAQPGRHLRLAAVGHEPLIDPQRFGEDVAVNRGVNLRVFTDFGAARAWLDAP